jgi:hypothetical protein
MAEPTISIPLMMKEAKEAIKTMHSRLEGQQTLALEIRMDNAFEWRKFAKFRLQMIEDHLGILKDTTNVCGENLKAHWNAVTRALDGKDPFPSWPEDKFDGDGFIIPNGDK